MSRKQCDLRKKVIFTFSTNEQTVNEDGENSDSAISIISENEILRTDASNHDSESEIIKDPIDDEVTRLKASKPPFRLNLQRCISLSNFVIVVCAFWYAVDVKTNLTSLKSEVVQLSQKIAQLENENLLLKLSKKTLTRPETVEVLENKKNYPHLLSAEEDFENKQCKVAADTTGESSDDLRVQEELRLIFKSLSSDIESIKANRKTFKRPLIKQKRVYSGE